MDFNRLFPLSSLYFEPLSGRAVDSHVEHRRLGFVALARRHASHLVGLRSSSTVGNYLTALRSFSSFLGGTDVSLGAVTSRLVCGYARWLADRGVTRNTASCYLRSLRTLYRAVGSHARGGGNRPFADVFTGNVPTAKRAASVAGRSSFWAIPTAATPARSWWKTSSPRCLPPTTSSKTRG